MSLQGMYDFSSISDDKQGMILASKFDKATAAVVEDLTSWVHSIAVKFNNPKTPMLAARGFEEYMEDLAKFITSEEAGENQWTRANGHTSDFKLTGNNNVANAYKRTLSAVKLGGDLVGFDSKHEGGNELTTVSKCMKFVTKRNAELKKIGEQAQAVEELHQLIEEETGHERGTPEHEAIFQERSMQLVPDSEDKPASDAASKDIYDELGREFAAALRELREAGESEVTVLQMANSRIKEIGATINKVLNAMRKNVA